MERLTTRCSGYAVMAWEHEEKHTTQEWIDMLTDRLAAYEDTGLEPDEIKNALDVNDIIPEINVTVDHICDLLHAEQDGRLVVLPWAAGDVIYEADPAHGVVKHTFAGEPAWMMHSYAVDDAGNEWYDGWGSSDETPFYKTREEAEAALKGGEG